MLNALLGRKVGMTQVFGPNGTVIPVTVIEAGPCIVTQIKTVAHDGYEAVQIGFEQTILNPVERALTGPTVAAIFGAEGIAILVRIRNVHHVERLTFEAQTLGRFR